MSQGREVVSPHGFTAIEIVVVIVIITVLSIMGVSKYNELTIASRRESCLANAQTIDKAIAAWESQNKVTIPRGAALSITFDSNGTITASSGTEKLAPPPGAELKPRSTVIADLVKAPNVFVCPERAYARGGISHIHSVPEDEYTFLITETVDPSIRNKTRGVVCIHYGASGKMGPDDTPYSAHR